MNEPESQPQRTTKPPQQASNHAKQPPSPPVDAQRSALPPLANDHALKATVLSAATVDTASSSTDLVAPTPQPGGCGSACWMILGPVIAGVVVAAMVFGLVMVKRRRRLRSQSEADLKKEKQSGLDDDDLMVEMFEPPELLSSGNISGAFFNWRNASSPPDPPPKEGRRSSAQFSGRSTMLGLTTILEEGSNANDQARVKKFHGNIRRPSGKTNGGPISPLRITAPHPVLRGPLQGVGGLRSISVGDTPPLSPLISPSASPAPSESSALPNVPGQQVYLTAPVGGRPKRKLTIPYNPQDVTRRRSLEGAW